MKMLRLVVLILLASTMMYGQSSFNATAGGDQVLNTYGLQTEYKWHKLSGWTGFGYNNGIKFGGYLRVPFKLGENNAGYHLGIGDQRLSALLDVDEYDSHGFTVRGVNLTHKTKVSSLTLFSGFLSQETALPYMHTSYTSGSALQSTPLGAVLYQRQLSKTFQLHSLYLMGKKLTSIQSLGWSPSKIWRFGGAAGMGSGAKYLAGSVEFHKKRVDLRTSYTIAGNDFQRQEQPYYSTELLGLNARLTLTPISAVRLTFDHEQSRTNITGLPSVVGTFDSANLAASILGFQISPSVSTVRTDNFPGQTLTEMVSVSRRILPRWRTFAAYLQMESPTFKQQALIATNEFRVSPRLAVRQNYTRMNGQSNYSFGAQWVSNLISFSVDQQVFMSPLAAAFGGKSVFQAWTFNIRMRAPRGTNANINTMIAPDGKMQWGGFLSGMRYDSVAPYRSTSPLFSKYIIHGKVVDEAGNGVWGIAVKIGDEVLISDADGEFFAHVNNAKAKPLVVAKDSSLQSSRWTLVIAPSTAQGTLETAPGAPIQVVVQMVNSIVAKN